MAAYPDFTVTDLSNFSGRPVEEYSNAGYADTAILQAELLFQVATCLGDHWPDDAMQASLAQMAIMAMADAIYLSQPYQNVLANPFSSESIGSYSYSKIAGVIAGGLPTGITWFDLAVSKLGQCDLVSGITLGGGIEAFEDDGFFVIGKHPGNTRVLSPADFNENDSFGPDPSHGVMPGDLPPLTS